MTDTSKKVDPKENLISKEITPSIASINAVNDEKLIGYVSTNLNNLCNSVGINHKQLAEMTGYSEAAVCRYFKVGKNGKLPPIDFFYKLKQLFDISIDDFISRPIMEPVSKPDEGRLSRELEELKLGRKYCGNYLVYYLDTSNYKGRDYKNASESLVYGILCINEVETIDIPEFKCTAILGLRNRKRAYLIKERLDNAENFDDVILDVIPNTISPNIYKGTLEFGTRLTYISLKHGNQDQALLVLYRIDNNKLIYNGGLATINSGSKGRETMPTSQFIGLSRYPLSQSPEEIHHELLLSYPTLKADAEVKDLISMFKNTYSHDSREFSVYTEYQKELMVKAYLESEIKKIITRNSERYAKISTRDDDAWYHLVKTEGKKLYGSQESDDDFDF